MQWKEFRQIILPDIWKDFGKNVNKSAALQPRGKLFFHYSSSLGFIQVKQVYYYIKVTLVSSWTIIKGELDKFNTSRLVYQEWSVLLSLWKQLCHVFCGSGAAFVESEKITLMKT